MRVPLAALVSVSLLAAGRAAATDDWTIRFDGKSLQDEKVGFYLLVPENRPELRELAVSSPRFGYFAMLPYARDWVFSGDAQHALKGTSSAGTVTIQVLASREDPERALAEEKKAREGPQGVPGLVRNEILKTPHGSVLRSETDAGKVAAQATGSTALAGARHVSYVVMRSRGGRLYRFHLSRAWPGEVPGAEDQRFIEYALRGFRADFPLE